MNPEDVEAVIQEAIPNAEVTVGRPRGVDDDDHLAAKVVSPAFEGKNLVEQHSMVFDALEEHMTTDVHALEVSTYTPDEARD